MILETLTGLRTPQEAADALGVASARYYQLETYALQGLVSALEPRPKGRQVSAERELEREREEVARLKREVGRQLALYRSAQRALGVPRSNGTGSAASGSTQKAGRKKAKSVRRRRKETRGERVAKALAEPRSVEPTTTSKATSQETS